MEPMVRKQLYLTPAQNRALRERARRERRSEADLVRQAVDRLLSDDPAGQVGMDALNRAADQIAETYPTVPPPSDGGRQPSATPL